MVATLVVHAIAWVVATFIADANQMVWTVVGGALCTAYSVVAMRRSLSTSVSDRINVALLTLSFPVWGAALYYPGVLIAGIVSAPFGHIRSVHWMISGLGGVQGLLFAVLIAGACRSPRLACVVGVAIVPAWFATIGVESVVRPHLSANMLALRTGELPFLPTLVVLWNTFVGIAMALWAAHRCRHPLPARIPRCPCGYDLRGLESDMCPECGKRRTR